MSFTLAKGLVEKKDKVIAIRSWYQKSGTRMESLLRHYPLGSSKHPCQHPTKTGAEVLGKQLELRPLHKTEIRETQPH